MLDAARARKEGTANLVLSALHESLAALDAAREVESLTRQACCRRRTSPSMSAWSVTRTQDRFHDVLDAQRQIRRARAGSRAQPGEQQIRLVEIERLIGEDL